MAALKGIRHDVGQAVRQDQAVQRGTSHEGAGTDRLQGGGQRYGNQPVTVLESTLADEGYAFRDHRGGAAVPDDAAVFRTFIPQPGFLIQFIEGGAVFQADGGNGMPVQHGGEYQDAVRFRGNNGRGIVFQDNIPEGPVFQQPGNGSVFPGKPDGNAEILTVPGTVGGGSDGAEDIETFGKSIIFHILQAVRQFHVPQDPASGQGPGADSFHALRNADFRQGGALFKGIVINGRQRGGQGNGMQVFTLPENGGLQAGDAFRDGNGFQAAAQESGAADGNHAVRKNDGLQVNTVCEGAGADRRQAVRQGNAGAVSADNAPDKGPVFVQQSGGFVYQVYVRMAVQAEGGDRMAVQLSRDDKLSLCFRGDDGRAAVLQQDIAEIAALQDFRVRAGADARKSKQQEDHHECCQLSHIAAPFLSVCSGGCLICCTEQVDNYIKSDLNRIFPFRDAVPIIS